MNKRFLINLIANIFSFIVNIGISLLLTPFLIRTLGKEVYGFFPLANNFISYASIITVALDSMASRFITIKIEQKDIKGANVYFNSVLIGNATISIALSVISIISVVYLDKILDIPIKYVFGVKILFALVFIGMIISIVTSVFGVATFTRNRLDLSSIRSIEGNVIKVILLLILFNFFKPSIWYLGVASLALNIYIFVTNLRYTKLLLPEIEINKKYYSVSAIKQLVSSGIWNSVNQLSFVLLTSLDLLICNIFLGAAASGEYAIVKTVPNFIQSFVGVLVGVFIPSFTILYAQGKRKELIESINKSIKFMGLIITIPIGFLIIFGNIFFSLWVPGQDVNTLNFLSILTILPMIITGSINTIFNVYTVTNKLKIPAIALLVTSILNTVSVLVLLKTTNLGIYSIPIVSLIIGLIRNLVFTPIYAAKCLNIKWNTFYISIFRGSFSAVVVIVVSYILKLLYSPHNWLGFILTGLICSVISIIVNSTIVLNKQEKIMIKGKISIIFQKYKFTGRR